MGRPKKVQNDDATAEATTKKPESKTVEAIHTIKYREPLTVPAAEPETEDADEWLADDAEDSTEEPVKTTRTPSLRARLKERLEKAGIAGAPLSLRIDRLPFYETNGLSGVNAEKEFVRKVRCVESYFDNDDYLENIRAEFGAGTYWLTVRAGKSIVAQWQERIGGTSQPANSSSENPVFSQYQPAAPVDPMASLLKQAKQFGELRKLLMPEAESQPQQAVSNGPQTTEQALLTLMNVDSGLVDTVAGKLRGLLRSSNGNAESEKSWLDVIYAAIERDTLPKLINQFATQFRPGQPVPTSQAQQQPAAPAEPPQSADAVAYQRLISVIVNCARVNGDVTPALQAIDGFVALFPEHAGDVDGFLNAPVEISLPALAQSSPMAAEVVAMPHAADWFGRLKTAFFDSGEIEETKQ